MSDHGPATHLRFERFMECREPECRDAQDRAYDDQQAQLARRVRERAASPRRAARRDLYVERLRCPKHKTLLMYPREWDAPGRLVAQQRRSGQRTGFNVLLDRHIVMCPVEDCRRAVELVKVRVVPDGSEGRLCTRSCVMSLSVECRCICQGRNHGTSDASLIAWWASF